RVLVLTSPLEGEVAGAEDGSGGWGGRALEVQERSDTNEERLAILGAPSPPTRRGRKVSRGDLPLKGGGQRLRRAAFALVLLVAALTAFAGCAEPQPPEFLSKEQKFRVRFGSPPKVYDQPDGVIPTKLFTVKSPDGAYTVRAYELPVTADAAAQASDKLLDE